MATFVTGTSSFIGSELLRLFQSRDIDFTGADLAAPAVSGCHTGDIRDSSIADLIPENAEAVIHLAALSRDQDCKAKAEACFEVNVMGTLNLMAAAEKRGVKQFIFASSEWVYDSFEPGVEKTEKDPINPHHLSSEYALSKLIGEINLLQKFQHGFCPVTVLRFGIVYGLRRDNWSAVESLFNAVSTSDEIEVGSRATARRFIHVSDIAEAIAASLGTPGFEIVNIQGPNLVSLGDIIDVSAKILDRSPKVMEKDKDAPNIRNVSGARAERLLGWRAVVDLSEGLSRFNDYLNAETS